MITGTSILTSFIVAVAAIPAGSRVKYAGGGTVSLAGVGDAEIGYAILDTGKLSYAVGDAVGVMLKHPIRWAVAASALADGALLEPAALGQLDDTVGVGAAVVQTSVANATAAASDLATAEALANANKTQGNALVADMAALTALVNQLRAELVVAGGGIALGAATAAGDLIPVLPR